MQILHTHDQASSRPCDPRNGPHSAYQTGPAQSSRSGQTWGVSFGARPPGGAVVGQAQLSRWEQSHSYQEGSSAEDKRGGLRRSSEGCQVRVA